MTYLVKPSTRFIEGLKRYQITIRQFGNLKSRINIKTRDFNDYC